MGFPSWGEGTGQTPKESQKLQTRSVSENNDMTTPANREGSGSGMASQSPFDDGTRHPSRRSDDFFSPRSTAAIALSSFAQRQPPYQSQDFSPPAAFDPPRATLRLAAKQKATEIQPKAASAANAASATLSHGQTRPQYLHGPPPTFSPYYSIPYWHQEQHQHHYPPPPPANAWQPAYSSTSLLPDPRVSALPMPEDPYSFSKSASLSHPLGAPQRDGFAVSSQPLQPLDQNPYYSQARQRPPPNAFVTPTPKKLRLAEPDNEHPLRPDPSLVSSASTISSASTAERITYSRKTKSLGVLAESFREVYASKPPGTDIVIDNVAKSLGVERRRIYDVMNIMESIKVVIKKAKNTYCWMGRAHLPAMFALLQREACAIYPDDAARNGLVIEVTRPNESPPKEKDTRSLCRLSQLFLQVYLVGNVEMSLTDSSDRIHGETTVKELAALGSRGREPVDLSDVKKFQQAASRGLKTKIRRLYDIANVFIALGILTKLDNPGLKSSNDRPTFRWSFGVSAKELLRVYKDMPDYMKDEETPFCEHRPSLLPPVLSKPASVPKTGSFSQPYFQRPPQPSPAGSEKDGVQAPYSESTDPSKQSDETRSSLPPQHLRSLIPSASSADEGKARPRRVSFPFQVDSQLG